MAQTGRFRVTADPQKGLVMLSLGNPPESFVATPREVLDLASLLTDAARRVQDKNGSADEDEEMLFMAADDDIDEVLNDVVDGLKHEEKRAHGGD